MRFKDIIEAKQGNLFSSEWHYNWSANRLVLSFRNNYGDIIETVPSLYHEEGEGHSDLFQDITITYTSDHWKQEDLIEGLVYIQRATDLCPAYVDPIVKPIFKKILADKYWGIYIAMMNGNPVR